MAETEDGSLYYLDPKADRLGYVYVLRWTEWKVPVVKIAPDIRKIPASEPFRYNVHSC